jgi:small conductance mechanosensitive channel
MIYEWFSIIQEKLHRWGLFIIKMLPNFLLALLILFAFVFLGKFIRRFIDRVVLRISKSESISGLTSAFIYSIIVVVGIMIALNILRLDKAVTSLLAGVGIIGLALGFAFQDLTANFISGTFIAFKRPFEVGHVVETNGFVGTVEDIQLRATQIRTFAGLRVIIPNKDIFQKPIINYSKTSRRRIELEFLILNKGDAAAVERAVENALKANRNDNSIQEVEVYYMQLEDPKIRMYVSIWTTHIEPNQFMKARHEAILIINSVLKENGVLTQ